MANSAISDDFEWPSQSLNYSKPFQMQFIAHMRNTVAEISTDKERRERKVPLRPLSLLFYLYAAVIETDTVRELP